MPQPPGYIEEASSGVSAIVGVETSLTVFIGTAESGPVAEPTEVMSVREYQRVFGDADTPLGLALLQYFGNGGWRAIVLRVPSPCTAESLIAGLAGLELIDYFGLLCLPETAGLGEGDARDVVVAALSACGQRRAFYLLDAPNSLSVEAISDWVDGLGDSSFGAAFFPPLRVDAPLRPGEPRVVGPAATLAGVCARNDRERGVWHSPGADAVSGAQLTAVVPSARAEVLASHGVNVLRHFPGRGTRVWGNRTLDAASNEYRYIPVRRLANYLEESVRRGTRWTAFERHDARTWARLHDQIASFLHQDLYRGGALLGTKPEQAYNVTCDQRNNTAADISAGRLNVHIGFAPVRPAEFLLLRLTLTAIPS